MSDTQAEMQRRLAVLVPLRLHIDDEAAAPRGHAGAAGGGGHFRLTLVSAAFAGKNTVARHRLVYDALGDMMRGPIHALAINALTPDQDSV